MSKKVVFLHDWLTGFRGGERVLEALLELYPQAAIYTLIHEKGALPASIEERKIYASWLNSIPGVSKHYRKFLPLFPMAASSIKLPEDTDLIISSSHCVIKGVPRPSGAKHISYIHSPMRYVYDQFENYFGPSAPFYQRWGMKLCRSYLQNWDQASNIHVDHMIANSAFVAERIKTYYHTEPAIIHPFVDLKDFESIQKSPAQKEDFYLMVTAFAPNKRVDLAIKAFNQSGRKLKIIGSGQQEKDLMAMAGKNIEFLGNLSREEVLSHFSRAKAFIFPGVEDFGITPLESLAAGTPVIAYKIGGVLETLNNDVAVFFEKPDIASLNEAVEQFEGIDFSREALFARAREFSRDAFKNKMKAFIEGQLN